MAERRFLSPLTTREQQRRIAARMTTVVAQCKTTFSEERYDALLAEAVSMAETNINGYLTYPGMAFVAEYLEGWLEHERSSRQ